MLGLMLHLGSESWLYAHVTMHGGIGVQASSSFTDGDPKPWQPLCVAFFPVAHSLISPKPATKSHRRLICLESRQLPSPSNRQAPPDSGHHGPCSPRPAHPGRVPASQGPDLLSLKQPADVDLPAGCCQLKCSWPLALLACTDRSPRWEDLLHAGLVLNAPQAMGWLWVTPGGGSSLGSVSRLKGFAFCM